MPEPRLKLVADPALNEWSSSHDHAGFLALRNGNFEIVVSEEQAMDSYNDQIDCTVYVTREQATNLRDWLTDHIPNTEAES